MKMRSFKYRLSSNQKIKFESCAQLKFQSKLPPIFTQHCVNYNHQKVHTQQISLKDSKQNDSNQFKQNFSRFKQKQKGASLYTTAALNKQNRTSIFIIKNRSTTKLTMNKKNIVQDINFSKRKIEQIECKDTIIQNQNLPHQIADAEETLRLIQKQSKQYINMIVKYSKQLQNTKIKIFNELTDIQTTGLSKIKHLWHELQKNKAQKCGLFVNLKQTIQKQTIKQNKEKTMLTETQEWIAKLQNIVNFE